MNKFFLQQSSESGMIQLPLKAWPSGLSSTGISQCQSNSWRDAILNAGRRKRKT